MLSICHFDLLHIVNVNPLVTPHMVPNIPESSTSVRKGKQLTVGQNVLHQLRRHISSDLNSTDEHTSERKIFTTDQIYIFYSYYTGFFSEMYIISYFFKIENIREAYKKVTSFNKLNRRFTISMRRHLKAHPLDCFMYHQDPRGYSMYFTHDSSIFQYFI